MFPRSVVSSVPAGVVGVAIILVMSLPADAARRKGKACMTGHFHYGSSAGERSKKVARAKAVASWAGFTAFECGNAWASFRRAGSKIVRCSQNETGWGCKVEAVPCRRR